MLEHTAHRYVWKVKVDLEVCILLSFRVIEKATIPMFRNHQIASLYSTQFCYVQFTLFVSRLAVCATVPANNRNTCARRSSCSTPANQVHFYPGHLTGPINHCQQAAVHDVTKKTVIAFRQLWWCHKKGVFSCYSIYAHKSVQFIDTLILSCIFNPNTLVSRPL